MIAVILSIIFPGLGHLYYGKTLKGIIMILLCLVPFLYPFILIWSIVDCLSIRKTVEIDPITQKEALTAILIFLVVIPLLTFSMFWIGLQVLDYSTNKYLKPNKTQSEMQKIYSAIEKYKSDNNQLPSSIQDLVGNRPIRQTWLMDSWGNRYSYSTTKNGEYILSSAGIDGQMGTEDDIILTGKSN